MEQVIADKVLWSTDLLIYKVLMLSVKAFAERAAKGFVLCSKGFGSLPRQETGGFTGVKPPVSQVLVQTLGLPVLSSISYNNALWS